MPARGLTLTLYEPAIVPSPTLSGKAFRVRITATEPIMIPTEVFLHRKNTLNPLTGAVSDEFCAIVSPEDLVTYPVGEPNPTDDPPFFRLAEVDAPVASRTVALKLFDEVHEEVCRLIELLNKLDTLVEVQSVRCGAPEETSASVSV